MGLVLRQSLWSQVIHLFNYSLAKSALHLLRQTPLRGPRPLCPVQRSAKFTDVDQLSRQGRNRCSASVPPTAPNTILRTEIRRVLPPRYPHGSTFILGIQSCGSCDRAPITDSALMGGSI